MRRKVLGLAGAGVSLAVGAALVASSATTAGAAPAAKQNQDTARPAVVGAFVPVAPGQNGIASVTCPAGTILTGGGGQTSAFRIFFTDSFRSGNTWTIRGTNTGTATEQLRAVAVCVGVS